MYFLAFDATSKGKLKIPLDFNPKKKDGLNNRQKMEIEFVRLVQLKNGRDGKLRQVVNLGQINKLGASPEKRISSNFFTTPLKKASQSAAKCLYPTRPAPVLIMGNLEAGLNWGIDYCTEWSQNLPKLLKQTKSNSPFTDLAVFVLRDTEFRLVDSDYIGSISEKLTSRFSTRLSEYWVKKIAAEKIYSKHLQHLLQDTPPSFPSEEESILPKAESRTKILGHWEKKNLVDRILFLENLLKKNNVSFTV
jgi:hypothetical protein